jgi:PAS domain S-box-containing protein
VKLAPERKITAGFAAATVLLLLAGATAWWNARRLNESRVWVDHTHQVLSRLEQVLTTELSMQTSTRGFVITGDVEILGPFEKGRAELATALEDLHRLITDNEEQQRRLAETEIWINRAAEIMNERIAARRQRGLGSITETSRFLDGQRAVENVRTRVQEMEESERRLLGERLVAADRAATANLTGIVVTAGLAAGLVALAAVVTRRQFFFRQRTEQTLRNFNEELETRVRQRTGEFETANRALKLEIAERKRVEEVVRKSETGMNEAQRQAKIGNWELDLITQKGTWSEELFRLHGRDPGLGAPVFAEFIQKMVHPEDRDGLLRAHGAAMANNVPMIHEYRTVRPDGSTRWVLARTEGFRDETGTLIRRAGTEQDITERVGAEQALRNSERRFRALIEHSADGISLIDANNNILYLSPAVAGIEGYTAEELAGRNGIENTHPDDIPLIHDIVRQLIADPGKPFPVLWRRRHKDGHWLWLEGVATNLLEDPAVRAIVTNYRDVTERKRIEEVRARFVSIVESSQDAIVSKTLDGTITSWNRGAEKIFGYAAVEAIGQAMLLVIPPDYHPEEKRILARIQRGESIDHFETKRRTRDGQLIDVSVTISPIKDGSGRVVGASTIARDITAHRRAREEIRELNEKLEERVARRTAELEAANKELEAFSYSVSHDLRAPLRHVDGFAGLLQKHLGSTLDEKGSRYLTTIAGAARQMGRLIDDLLAFSRMARAPLNVTTLDHDALVASVIREGNFQAPGKTIDWRISPLPRVQADAAMLRQVWFNLIDNAVKYSGKSAQPQIEIGSLPEARPLNGGPREDVFFVRDNGVGFDMTYVEKLFGVFQRLHGPAEFEGTGIGLANVRRIISRHHGRTWAEGRIGEGATFYFSLRKKPDDGLGRIPATPVENLTDQKLS